MARVLIAESDRLVYSSIQAELELAGHEVDIATDYETARARLEDYIYDCAFFDFNFSCSDIKYLEKDELRDLARLARDKGAKTICLVSHGFDFVEDRIRKRWGEDSPFQVYLPKLGQDLAEFVEEAA